MLEGDARREKLLNILSDSPQPVSGSRLSKMLGVSRQVIVQDIALLRAVDKNILATTRGYILYTNKTTACHRSYCVNHDANAIADELNTIIDNGGKVLDIIIEHDVYGQISANLVLETRKDVDNFCRLLKASKAKPLNIVADGIHYHTVEASSEVILDNIERALAEKGYLVTN
jgi:transcriptional regulator of NAD metabolism